TWGAANDVPVIAVKSGFDGGEFHAADGAITAPAGAVRSGLFRPAGVGPRELIPRTTSSLEVTVPTSLNPPTVSTFRPMFPTVGDPSTFSLPAAKACPRPKTAVRTSAR